MPAALFSQGIAVNGYYQVVTSSTRPAGANGMTIFETDTGRLRTWDGSQWLEIHGPNYAWTPAILSGLTLGNGTIAGHYALRGLVMNWSFDLTCGSSTVMGTTPKIQPPGTMILEGHAGSIDQVASAVARDASTGTFYAGSAWQGDSSDNVLTTRVIFNTTLITVSTPFTWAVSDQLTISGTTFMADVDAPTS